MSSSSSSSGSDTQHTKRGNRTETRRLPSGSRATDWHSWIKSASNHSWTKTHQEVIEHRTHSCRKVTWPTPVANVYTTTNKTTSTDSGEDTGVELGHILTVWWPDWPSISVNKLLKHIHRVPSAGSTPCFLDVHLHDGSTCQLSHPPVLGELLADVHAVLVMQLLALLVGLQQFHNLCCMTKQVAESWLT